SQPARLTKCCVLTALPNVFTPNGDPMNEWFGKIDCNLPSFTLKVYNRWGLLLFNSDENGNCWDGKSNGTFVSEGVYFYILNHKNKYYHGTITLRR
ncbi:MAG: gliding motility-associated C-terminal domain-containing protein, partial [Bacteroidota bacterium]